MENLDEYLEWGKEIAKLSDVVALEYSLKEIIEIWRDYSKDLAAGWISVGAKEGVERVFAGYKKIDGVIYKKI